MRKSTYEKAVAQLVTPIAERYASNTVQRLLGFWVVWHLLGGFHGLKAAGWPEPTIYRNKAEFVKAFGTDVGGFMPEVIGALVKEAARAPEAS